MQKGKRKSDENGVSSPKKKKLNSSHEQDSKIKNTKNKTNLKGKKFNKDGVKGFKKFTKNDKGSKFVKTKEKSNFSKDEANGEKPKWAEMKKEKKQLRTVRRKAKITAEVFEISHKAKLLAAQIQRYFFTW